MDNYLKNIVIYPNICHGQPVIKGTRIMVYLILELLEAGITPQQIINDYYPSLSKEDITSCLHYASILIKEQEFTPFILEEVFK
ncbi:MAG: DUF433 domain-containing protein [bacterium]